MNGEFDVELFYRGFWPNTHHTHVFPGAGMAIPRGTARACRFLSGRVFAGFRIYPGSVVFILVITTNPDNLSLPLGVYLPTARFFHSAATAAARRRAAPRSGGNVFK
jgi:hypothetical protein